MIPNRKVLMLFVALMTTPFFVGILSAAYDAEILKKTCHVTVSSSGKKTASYEYTIQINNRLGDAFTKISIPYTKGNKVDALSAYIKDRQGKVIRKLKKSEIKDYSTINNGAFYSDDYHLDFEIKHTEYPYTLHYQYKTTSSDYLYISYFTPVEYLNIPTDSAILTVDIPEDYQIKVKSRFVDTPVIDTFNATIRYKWISTYKDIQEKEHYAMSRFDRVPLIKIVPLHFVYALPGNTATWKTYGNWLNKLSSGKNDLPEEEWKKIVILTSTEKDTIQKIKKLFYYLQQNTRYVNVSLGSGGMVPHAASYVAKNKYGDCKALTNYMKSALEVIGVPSFCADINRGTAIDYVDLDFPSQQFNHVILGVPIKDDTVWIENTSALYPFGYVESSDQNKDILIIKDNGSYMARTPAMKMTDVLEKETYTADLSKPDEVLLNGIYRGPSYEYLIWIKENLKAEKQRNRVESLVVPYSNTSIESFDLVVPDQDKDSILLSAQMTSHDFYKTYGKDVLFHLPRLDIPNLRSVARRQSPISIPYPVNIEQNINIGKPDNVTLITDDLEIKIDSQFGTYERSYTIDYERINIKVVYQLKSGFHELSAYSEFADFLNQVKKTSSHSINFQYE